MEKTLLRERQNPLKTSTRLAVGLLVVRLALAGVFIAHGIQKFSDISGTSIFFGQIGLSLFFVYLVALVELLGGIAMLAGIWTGWAGILLAVDMFFAIYLVKLSVGFLGGYELELTLLLTALGVSLAGPGKYSVSETIRTPNRE